LGVPSMNVAGPGLPHPRFSLHRSAPVTATKRAVVKDAEMSGAR